MVDSNLELVRGGAQFTIDLFKTLAAGGVRENIVFSPFSIQTCLALAFAGADGETAEEIATAMKFGSNCPSEVAATFKFGLEKYQNSDLLKIASKVYVQEGYNLKPDYASTTKDNYYAEAEEINFAESENAAQSVNSWVESKTAGKITNLVESDSFDALTRLVLLNALHFKAEWNDKFDESLTKEDDFWVTEGHSVKVTYMNKTGNFGYGYLEELNCQALEMPYKDSDLSMLVFLPNEREGLKKLAEQLDGVNLVDLAGQMSTSEVVVKFPKFKIEFSVELSNVLKELGINKAFGDEANFSKILESTENLYISKVIHKACIEVNEEGSEASAATAVLICRMMMLHLEFQCDHPFLYMIWNKKNILFAGAFLNAPH